MLALAVVTQCVSGGRGRGAARHERPRRSISPDTGSRSSPTTGAGAWSRRRRATSCICRSTTTAGAWPSVGSCERRSRGRGVPRVWRRRHHASARSSAHHLGERHDAEARDRHRTADAPLFVRRHAAARRGRGHVAGIFGRDLGASGRQVVDEGAALEPPIRPVQGPLFGSRRRTCGRATIGGTACPMARMPG